jgi:hypothetical protein
MSPTELEFIILLSKIPRVSSKGQKMESRDTRTWKIIVLALIIGLLGGVVSAALVAPLFVKPGPQGETGPAGLQGPQGQQGEQGSQGNPGTNGTDAILQILQNRNDTVVDISDPTLGYAVSEWFNMSDFDSSMKMTINIQEGSKIFVQFSSSNTLSSGASILVRIVVDNVYNSSICKASSPSPPSSGTYSFPAHMEFLTGPLSSGQHTIEVQFQRDVAGPSMQLERSLTVTEITTP